MPSKQAPGNRDWKSMPKAESTEAMHKSPKRRAEKHPENTC